MSLKSIIKYSKELTLLYVEDDEDTRVSTLNVFKEIFKEVIVAIDGNDGLKKFKNHKIDLIISDINMPHKNGLEMIKDIRKIDIEVPIMILSAHNEAQYFVDSISLNVDGYILKPMDISQFTQALFKSIQKIKLKDDNNKYKKSLNDKNIAKVSNEDIIKQIDQLMKMMNELKSSLQ